MKTIFFILMLFSTLCEGQNFFWSHNTIYYSVRIHGDIRKNDCPVGQTGTLVHVDIPYATYQDITSQVQANALAATAGQVYANTYGSCVSCTVTSSIDDQVSTISVTSSSISINCSGNLVASFSVTPTAPVFGRQVDIYNASSVYVATENPVWTQSPAGTWSINTTLSTSLSNGYSIVIYLSE